ncbi:hemolysin XhlA family protein [Lacticaseibacillus porcinae]|uniref:hemolysin XhlA family protein n=1 Tax=Lacticaseibacillus porcinae TaxID=1123687 RepID=UPI000F7856C1|nr:hemolysin XhlA family protein [Lacticaseibacillus porcinae]
MPDKEEVNVMQTLMTMGERLARIEANTAGLHHTDRTAVEALNQSQQNTEDIKQIKSQSQWSFRTAITAVLIPIAIYLFQTFVK